MSTSEPSTAARALSIVRVIGYLVFIAAYFLPAVGEPGHNETYKGSFCAWVTLINSFNAEFLKSKYILAIFSGWINPLMLLYIACQFSVKLRWVRRVLAGLIVVFILCTWVFFYLAPMVPLIGHWMWIAGILMILAGELKSKAPSATVLP